MIIRLKAERLREIAARQGITLGGLCERAGLSPNHLSKVLAGRHNLSARKRGAILAALDADFDDVFVIVSDSEAACA